MTIKITKQTGLAEAALRYTIDVPTVWTEAPNLEETLDAFMDAIELHSAKAKDYDGMENRFGLRGEIIGMTRKSDKLVKLIWDGKDPLFEGAQEIMMDLIGTMGIMLRMQKMKADKYRSSWRDNHGNKPTFGPPLPAATRRASEVRAWAADISDPIPHVSSCDRMHPSAVPCNQLAGIRRMAEDMHGGSDD